jgi:hypothetical protein
MKILAQVVHSENCFNVELLYPFEKKKRMLNGGDEKMGD